MGVKLGLEPSCSENVIEGDPYVGLGIDERKGLKWVLKGTTV
jgi:hypothetical protein